MKQERIESLRVNKTEESALSANDLRLKRYLELKDLVKSAEKELAQIKVELEHQGSHTTRHFVVIVSEQVRTLAPTLPELRKLWPAVDQHTRESICKLVKVAKKGSES